MYVGICKQSCVTKDVLQLDFAFQKYHPGNYVESRVEEDTAIRREAILENTARDNGGLNQGSGRRDRNKGKKLKSIFKIKPTGFGNRPVHGGEASDQMQENEERMCLTGDRED